MTVQRYTTMITGRMIPTRGHASPAATADPTPEIIEIILSITISHHAHILSCQSAKVTRKDTMPMMRNTAPTMNNNGKKNPPITAAAPIAINAIAPIHERMQIIVTPRGLSTIFPDSFS